ncbi:MAG: DMT family transporter [Lactobacillaceae bacterium]|jgi:transporter family-2 protein|nr:DMT family transporter [Lactobacillaceae bacterium]
MQLAIVFFPILLGSFLSFQSAVNSNLRKRVLSPFFASGISYFVGSLYLIILTLITRHTLLISSQTFSDNPWWIWLGGFIGVFGLPIGLVLFPILGATQASVLPILGQIVMGVLIDQFGLFDSAVKPLTWLKFAGIILVVFGMLIATGFIGKHQDAKKVPHEIVWQIIGVLSGIAIASQATINGQLGIALKSPIYSAAIAFSIGTILMNLFATNWPKIKVPFSNIKNAFKIKPKQSWIFLGGILGGSYILGTAVFTPMIGTGQFVVLSLIGQLGAGIAIDQFGLFGLQKKPISFLRIVGILIMVLGVLVVKVF